MYYLLCMYICMNQTTRMEIEVISTDCIKPRRPTPQHLRTHKISLLDQFLPPIHIPMLLFYAASSTSDSDSDSDSDTTQHQHRVEVLKQSLSEALTHFYPLAGRIKDKLSIECNDEGVHFTEAKSSCTLLELLNQSQGNFSSHIHKLLPSQPSWEAAAEGPVAMIQATCFPCGGIVIGTLVSHMIADGAAASFFLNSWGAISRSRFHSSAASASLFPDFDIAPSKFPRNTKDADVANLMAIFGPFLNKDRIGMRRFLFGGEAISKLKAQGSSLTGVQNPTRVEAVSSLICKCIAKAANSDRTLVTHAVNMRTRASPAFSDSCMGNFVWLAMMALTRGEELPELVSKMREAITGINSEFVKGLEGGGYVRYGEVLKQMVETATTSSSGGDKVNFVHCTSWCNFGLYGVDYGWGKPTWVSCTSTSPEVETLFVNSVLLMDTAAGSGIEAWIYVKQDHITILEQDKDLLTFATLDPNPLPSI